jgi:GDSL/SGNH-like Acyl-Esterase family found in Pmr5 and Cas1p
MIFIGRGCYFQANGSLKLGMSINSAFEMALQTWASWVESSVNTTRTHVFFRTFEPSHWRLVFL